MNKVFLVSLLVASFQLHAKLVDKVVAVIDDQIVTLSEVTRIKRNYPARALIASLVYERKKDSTQNILDSMVKVFVIRKKLTELGIIIDDESVESRVKQIEKSQGVTRDFLVSYLNQQNLSFDEYFELIKQMMEVSYFNSKIISPLVSVSDQEIKNFYSDAKATGGTSFTYEVVDFAISDKILKLHNKKQIVSILKKYQTSGLLPSEFAEMSTNKLSLEGQNLNPKISSVLKKTGPKSFSETLVLDGIVHVFYVESKKTSSSSSFTKNKNQLRQQLMIKKSKETINKWVDNERANYFIKYFI